MSCDGEGQSREEASSTRSQSEPKTIALLLRHLVDKTDQYSSVVEVLDHESSSGRDEWHWYRIKVKQDSLQGFLYSCQERQRDRGWRVDRVANVSQVVTTGKPPEWWNPSQYPDNECWEMKPKDAIGIGSKVFLSASQRDGIVFVYLLRP